MENFKLLKIEDSLKNSLEKMKFTKPTPIQAMAIPVALEGKDILGTAQTGTGKTLAFSVPLINKLILDKNAFALVMCPTRELATQVMAAIKSIISDKINIKTALLIGGEAMQKQLRQLGNRSRIIVGTPGRINDHLKRKSLNLSATKYLVLDETDRMLDMGFTPQIELILKFVPKDHQTLLFSATLPQNIVRISERYLNKPQRISTGSTSVPIAKIKQETLQVFKENKYDQLVDQFITRKGSILVFVKTKRGADKMVKRLKEEGHSADAIHGDLRQSKRDRVITSFRKGLKRILIATDVAARGLDIPLIQHVINFDLPQVPEDYVHRIGRTARAGTEGSALTFLTPDDRSMWNEISKLIDPNFKPAPRGARGDSRGGKRGKAPYNKKRKFRDEKKSFGKGRPDRSSRDGEKKSFGYKGKSSFGDKSKPSSYGRSSSSSRDGEKKSFGYKGKSSFGDKSKPSSYGRSSSSSRDGEKKSFGYKGKSSFGDKSKPSSYGRSSSSSRDGEKKSFGYKGKSSFGDKSKPSSYGRSSSSSRDGEKKSFGYKGKSSFTKKDNSKPTGFTNNPKYFGKKTSESSFTSGEKKSSSFNGKKKFKSRSDRPKTFTFKKHSQKRAKV
ncbi:DEAD/DEAH box helicase [Candidatus Pelagibacter giovannonii]|uniref:DEAD/DEAH box helicase n=1 Tax=Candidatus Pelagibacter giovannonii TaxID=2563896 RepID=A0A6H1Q327_9PROT|nr:DEAD/DEAH box helicase [Candidatus Pelagibacter giovannonii]QIZ21234.1 DEAD/DEAH box helicase [Candidatus Pelagibacter giovannonii]